MQLARFAATTPVAPATADFNLHVITTSEFRPDGTYVVDASEVTFGAAHRDGGFVFQSTYFPDGYVRMGVRQISGNATERAAAQAVQDAVRASGLLALAVPAPGIGRPAPGYTRIYLDRRSSMVEFPISAPPAPAQAVLDAVAAYTRLR